MTFNKAVAHIIAIAGGDPPFEGQPITNWVTKANETGELRLSAVQGSLTEPQGDVR